MKKVIEKAKALVKNNTSANAISGRLMDIIKNKIKK
jgi:hypothetical protein